MSNRNFDAARRNATAFRMAVDFRTRLPESYGLVACKGDERCDVDTYHLPGCPKLAADLKTWKAQYKEREHGPD